MTYITFLNPYSIAQFLTRHIVMQENMSTNDLSIPARPSILLELQALMQQEELDLIKITQLIKHDVALYSAVLSTVNSPWMGLRQKVKSIETAISLVGLEQLIEIIQGVIIRSCFQNISLRESFWDAATEVASISQNLAERFTNIKSSDAYSAGMLHNAGVPIMMMNFDDYDKFIVKHTRRPANEICVLERQTYETDHYLQGALMAKKWHMNSNIILAVRYQPIAASVLSENNKQLTADILSMIAVLTLAKDISNEYQHYWKVEANEFHYQCVEAALKHLNITEAEYAELKEDAISELMEQQVA